MTAEASEASGDLMKLELNKLQTVPGTELRDFLNSVDARYAATYEVDVSRAYVVTFWLDASSYDKKKTSSDALRKSTSHGRKKSCGFQQGEHFYICLFSAVTGDEVLQARPTEPTKEERDLLRSPAGKILEVVDDVPKSTQDIAKAAGLSYARTLKSLDKFKALGKIVTVKAVGVKFGEGKPPRMWIAADKK